ncbi:hypothetical protein AMATHDRAFT_11425 [Amanita thiersii Skay4041]|uniref:Uncharacterized protein n=1 Tax=Amanita thiersii Skay4041 TaxID=703135 RepID=A0A2A9N5Y9_9AGAR|nr:hypothetical protein AMATHDRAFT_11425 [Amanita thiersii Skay4041]
MVRYFSALWAAILTRTTFKYYYHVFGRLIFIKEVIEDEQQSALERQVWELFCEELGLSPDSDEPLTDEQEAYWQQIRRGSQNETSDLESVYSETRAPDNEPDQPSSPESINWLSDELQRLNMEQQAAATAAEAQAKQYRRIIQDPGEFNGQKLKFRKWHLNMKSLLKGYHNLNDNQKILIFLS